MQTWSHTCVWFCRAKRLLLLKEMLESYGYPGKTLVDDIINGFPLKAPERETGVTNRFVTFGHTEARVEELTALIEAILERGAMSCKDAERLRERLQWFETFSHGRVGPTGFESRKRHGFCWQETRRVRGKEIRALQFLRSRILTAAHYEGHGHQFTNVVCVFRRSLRRRTRQNRLNRSGFSEFSWASSVFLRGRFVETGLKGGVKGGLRGA